MKKTLKSKIYSDCTCGHKFIVHIPFCTGNNMRTIECNCEQFTSNDNVHNSKYAKKYKLNKSLRESEKNRILYGNKNGIVRAKQ